MTHAHFAPMHPAAKLQHLPPGTIVTTPRGFYSHVGILTEDVLGAERRVISLNPGLPGSQVREEPLSVFSQGKPIFARPGQAISAPWAVLARARSGRHPSYSWVTFNCEHFANFALGAPVKSTQIAFWGLTATALFLLSR